METFEVKQIYSRYDTLVKESLNSSNLITRGYTQEIAATSISALHKTWIIYQHINLETNSTFPKYTLGRSNLVLVKIGLGPP